MSALTEVVLAVLMVGNTHYVDVGQKTDAVIYYESAKVAHMTLPGQNAWVGDVTMKPEGYFVAWKNGPSGDWQITHEAGTFTYIGPDGEPAGTISKIVPGNPEGY